MRRFRCWWPWLCGFGLLCAAVAIIGYPTAERDGRMMGNPHYDDGPTTESYGFRWSTPDEPYLQRLRTEYSLERIVGGAADDYAKVRALALWAHNLWQHHGENEPRNHDPISILEEVRQGKKFRCVEYAVVISGCLNALGIPSRVLALKTEDVETRKSGAGHVVAEAYVRDLDKWILVDGQWDVIPLLDEIPLSAVELQQALAENRPELAIHTGSDSKPAEYFKWIGPYLFYLDVSLDNRVAVADRSCARLMLVPVGAKKPTVFQQDFPIRDMVYTHSVRAFYAKPG